MIVDTYGLGEHNCEKGRTYKTSLNDPYARYLARVVNETSNIESFR